ncbi:hypothetical protein DV737_g157, partial [Chaetothyriales sp. CBS 132003]
MQQRSQREPDAKAEGCTEKRNEGGDGGDDEGGDDEGGDDEDGDEQRIGSWREILTFSAERRCNLEWKLTYVGSATSAEHDQELDSLLVGPIPIGVNKFIFEADPPNLARLPSSEILGVTVILLTCAYDGREFVRVGYYVNNEYDSEELNNDPPAKPIIERVRRNILAEKPRVTRFAIKWDSEDSAPAEYPPDQPEADQLDDDGAAHQRRR